MLHYRLFKEINDLFASGRDDQARRLLMEIQSRSIALHDEVNLLQTRLKTLEEAMRLSCNLFRRNGLYWLKAQDINLGPFCPHCYDHEGGLIRLERSKGALHCPYCHTVITRPSPLEDGGYEATGEATPRARIIPFAN